MKRKIILCMMLAVFCLISACGKEQTGVRESVVKKEAEQQEGFKPEEASIKEAPAFEKDGVSVSVTEISYEDVVTKLHFSVKNETEQTLRITTANLSVNDMMCPEYLECLISAGKEENASVEIGNDWLAKMGIQKITSVEFTIKAYDEKNEEVISSDKLSVTTEGKGSYKQTYDENGYEIYNGNGIRLLARSISKSELSDDMEITFYCENNSKNDITIMSDDETVNGMPMDPLFVLSVASGKKAVDTMVFYNEDLEKNEIGEIETVTAIFKAFNQNLETVFETEPLYIPIQ